MNYTVRLNILAASLWLIAFAAPVTAQDIGFTSSNLPIFVIDTSSEEIPDEPKIPGTLGVIDNGSGTRNHLTDPFNGYDGQIGIEVRGSTSQMFPKKSYAFETREADGSNNNVPLLGMPEENDWILYAPYSDKSLLRNVLAYTLARRTGRYASRTRFCEVVINGQYMGVYVLLEQIKRDSDRVDIATLNPDETEGDDLTGGYIVKVDRPDGNEDGGWNSDYLANDSLILYQYHDPEADEIVPEQAAYIQARVDAFEDVMASGTFDDPVTGYPSLIDVGSFVDYFLVNEISKNLDAYRLSAYLHKDKDSNDPRFVMGPVWDFNFAFGNAEFYNAQLTAGFQVFWTGVPRRYPVPFWWPRFAESAAFVDAVNARWQELRAGPFHPDSVDTLIEEHAALLEESQTRNFERWPILGTYIWPNAFVGETYADEVEYLKDWTRQRGAWIDANIGALGVGVNAGTDAPPRREGRLVAYPNPSRGDVHFSLTLAAAQHVRIAVYDLLGREVARLHDGPLAGGAHRFTWSGGLASGVYVVATEGEAFTAQQRVTLLP